MDALAGTLEDLSPIQRMLKRGESTKLQAEMQKLRTEEACFAETLQPWQARLSDMALKIIEMLSHAQQIQTEVTSLMEEQLTVDLVDTAKATIEQITTKIEEIRVEFT